jgi:hypothetical protein
VVLPDVVDPLVDPLQRAGRLARVAHEDDPLDDVRVLVVTDDPETRRRSDARLGDVPHAHRGPLRLREDDVVDVVHVLDEPDRAHGVRLLADDEPLPADVRVRGLHRVLELSEVDPLAGQPIGVHADVVLLRLAAEADDVDDAADLLELALEDPVLRGLQVHLRVTLADDLVPEHLADRVPGRQLRPHPVRQLHELDPVDDLLPRRGVASLPREVTLHVREPEERLRSNVLEPRRSIRPAA